jgi:hypothetical protein
MLHVTRSKTGALAAAAIVSSALAFTFYGIAYGKRDHAAAEAAMMSIASVDGRTATVNKLAPDISWREQTSGKLHRLSELRGKPVVLCFGSYTCGPFRSSLNLFDQMYRRNKGNFACLLIYTKEAHPELSHESYMHDSNTLKGRVAAACDLSKDAHLAMPIVLDTLDNRAATTFAARPSRIYVLDPKGRIVFASREIPASDMARGVVQAVETMIASNSGK